MREISIVLSDTSRACLTRHVMRKLHASTPQSPAVQAAIRSIAEEVLEEWIAEHCAEIPSR
jgi:hypothetical protein